MSPLEQVHFEFGISGVSRAFSHQFVRHRIGISFEQQSQRYVTYPGGKFPYTVPKTVEKAGLGDDMTAFFAQAGKLYEKMVEAGVPAEDARFLLPNATNTNFKITVNFASMLHISDLRLCTRAQWEFRKVVSLMRAEVIRVAPELGRQLQPKCGERRLGYCDEDYEAWEACPIGRKRPTQDRTLQPLRRLPPGRTGRPGRRRHGPHRRRHRRSSRPRPLDSQSPRSAGIRSTTARLCYPVVMTLTHTTYQLRGYVSKRGHERLDDVLRLCCELYNAALEEWSGPKRARGIAHRARQDREKANGFPSSKHVNYNHQSGQLTGIRQDLPEFRAIHWTVTRGVLRRFDRARRSFMDRVKQGRTPGYPRFKPLSRYALPRALRSAPQHGPSLRRRPARLDQDQGAAHDQGQSRSRPLPPSDDIKSLRIIRKPIGVYVDLVYEVERDPLPTVEPVVGIDAGVSKRLALSDGSHIEGRKLDRRRQRRLQRRLSRSEGSKKGQRKSNRFRKRARSLAREQHRNKVRNRNECHRITTEIVRKHGLIAVEALTISNMTRSAAGTVEEPGRNVAQKRGLNRSIHEQTWGLIRNQLAYKAEWAGREYVEVDPRYTSQTCSVCGVVDARFAPVASGVPLRGLRTSDERRHQRRAEHSAGGPRRGEVRWGPVGRPRLPYSGVGRSAIRKPRLMTSGFETGRLVAGPTHRDAKDLRFLGFETGRLVAGPTHDFRADRPAGGFETGRLVAATSPSSPPTPTKPPPTSADARQSPTNSNNCTKFPSGSSNVATSPPHDSRSGARCTPHTRIRRHHPRKLRRHIVHEQIDLHPRRLNRRTRNLRVVQQSNEPARRLKHRIAILRHPLQPQRRAVEPGHCFNPAGADHQRQLSHPHERPQISSDSPSEASTIVPSNARRASSTSSQSRSSDMMWVRTSVCTPASRAIRPADSAVECVPPHPAIQSRARRLRQSLRHPRQARLRVRLVNEHVGPIGQRDQGLGRVGGVARVNQRPSAGFEAPRQALQIGRMRHLDRAHPHPAQLALVAGTRQRHRHPVQPLASPIIGRIDLRKRQRRLDVGVRVARTVDRHRRSPANDQPGEQLHHAHRVVEVQMREDHVRHRIRIQPRVHHPLHEPRSRIHQNARIAMSQMDRSSPPAAGSPTLPPPTHKT